MKAFTISITQYYIWTAHILFLPFYCKLFSRFSHNKFGNMISWFVYINIISKSFFTFCATQIATVLRPLIIIVEYHVMWIVCEFVKIHFCLLILTSVSAREPKVYFRNYLALLLPFSFFYLAPSCPSALLCNLRRSFPPSTSREICYRQTQKKKKVEINFAWNATAKWEEKKLYTHIVYIYL